MRNITSVTALLLFMLCSLCILSSQSSTVEVQSGQSVTLLCSNYTSSPTVITWFRTVRRAMPSCISTIFKPSKPATLFDGFKDGKFTVTSNLSHIFLTIESVNSSDSGLYFCGYKISDDPIIKSPTYLDVQEELFDREVLVPILGSLVVFLITVVICLALKNKKLQKAHNQELHEQTAESLHCSDNLDYATVTFHPKKQRTAINTPKYTTIYSAVR